MEAAVSRGVAMLAAEARPPDSLQGVLELRLEGVERPVPTDWVFVQAQDYDELIERAQG